jgi:hypothetical protein
MYTLHLSVEGAPIHPNRSLQRQSSWYEERVKSGGC